MRVGGLLKTMTENQISVLRCVLPLVISRSLLSFKQAIILAGGLSQNPYLKGKMRGHFESQRLPEQRPISIQIRPS
jgi:hypothetical protein